MNDKTSARALPLLAGGVFTLFLCSAALAQSDPSADDLEQPSFVSEDTTIDRSAESGLTVEEMRFENRLDGFSVRHDDSAVVDYYDLSDPDVQRREGGIQERGAMRTWRIGIGKK